MYGEQFRRIYMWILGLKGLRVCSHHKLVLSCRRKKLSGLVCTENGTELNGKSLTHIDNGAGAVGREGLET